MNASRLKNFLEKQLPLWREHTGLKDAKVIFLAHSMGGLVARYYLEVLEGWQDCKALFTFGTPYRGSMNAIDFFANGYKLLKLIDLTDVRRSLPSVYQLMPRQPVLKIGDEYQSIAKATLPLPVAAMGDRGIAIGGDANGATIVTNNHNVVGNHNVDQQVRQKGKYNTNLGTAQNLNIDDVIYNDEE